MKFFNLLKISIIVKKWGGFFKKVIKKDAIFIIFLIFEKPKDTKAPLAPPPPPLNATLTCTHTCSLAD